MQIGAVYPQIELRGDPSAVRRLGLAVEELGFDYLLAYDHVLGAVHADRTPQLTGPYTEHDPFHDPFVMFAYLAAITERLQFATGILILPQRQTARSSRAKQPISIFYPGVDCGSVSGSAGTTSNTKRSGSSSVPAAPVKRNRSDYSAGSSQKTSSTSPAGSIGSTAPRSYPNRRGPSRSGSVDPPRRHTIEPRVSRTASSSSAGTSTTPSTPGLGCATACGASAGLSRSSARSMSYARRTPRAISRPRSMPGARQAARTSRWSPWASALTPSTAMSVTSHRSQMRWACRDGCRRVTNNARWQEVGFSALSRRDPTMAGSLQVANRGPLFMTPPRRSNLRTVEAEAGDGDRPDVAQGVVRQAHL